MQIITATEKALTFHGDTACALSLIDSLRDAYGSNDMPKILNDFVFNMEVALQNAGVLDEHFGVMVG